MTDIPYALVSKAAHVVHERCIEMWREREKDEHAGITKHGPEAHEETARVYIAAVWDDIWAYGYTEGFSDQGTVHEKVDSILRNRMDRARALCDDPQGNLDERAVRIRYDRIRAALGGERAD